MGGGLVNATINSINVISPNGGEYLSGTQEITWNWEGNDSSDMVDIVYSTDGFVSSQKIIDTGVEVGSLSFLWNTDIDKFLDMDDYKIRLIDKKGLLYDTSDGTFTIDNTNPIVTIDSVTPLTKNDIIVITGTFTEVNLETIIVNDVVATLETGTYSAEINLEEGSNTITVVATDKAGNIGQSTETIVLDTIAPETTDNSISYPNWFNSDVTITLSCVDYDKTYYCVDKDNGCTPTIEGNSVIVSAEGENYIRYYSVDLAGNKEVVKSATNTIKIDKIEPVITIDDITLFTNIDTQTITFSIDELNLFEINVNEINVNVIEKNTYSVTINLVEGENKITIVATDLAGNIGQSTETIVLDVIAPKISSYEITNPVFSPNDDGVKDNVTIDLRFSEEVDWSIQILDENDVVYSWEGLSTNPHKKVWRGKDNSGVFVSDGTYAIKVTIEDKAGNQFIDESRTITLDTTAPIIEEIEGNVVIEFGEDVTICATIIGATIVDYYLEDFSGGMQGNNNEYCATISELNENQEYYITATDGVGNVWTSDSYTIEVADFKIALQEGWNLISIPLVPENDDTSIDTILSDVSENVDVVWAYTYDEVLGKNTWRYYDDETGNLDKIIPGYGYYIKMGSEDILYLNGKRMYGNDDNIAPKPLVVTLTPSWNLIGHYGLIEDISKSSALDTLSGSDSTILDKDGYSIADEEPLNPKQGYWLFLTGTDNLDYAPSEEAYSQ